MSSNRHTVSRDRLAEFQSSSTESLPFMPAANFRRPSNLGTYSQTERHEMTTVSVRQTSSSTLDTDEISDLGNAIKKVKNDINGIKVLQKESLSSVNPNQDGIKRLAESISIQNNQIKKRIQALPRSIHEARLRNEFKSVIEEYLRAETTYSENCRKAIARQIRMVNPGIDENELEKIVESDDPLQTQVFAQSLMQSRRGQANDALSAVESRNKDLKNILHTITELQQLFADMETLLVEQGQQLNQIESNTETIVVDLEYGNKDVDKAITHAKSTRTKKWICFGILLILIAIIAVLVWWFVGKH